MRFSPLSIPGVAQIEIEPTRDERGFFARVFCEQEFRAQGLPSHFPQQSVSFNNRRGTLRGLHYQREPHAEAKVVRCVRGQAFDVVVDLRRDSPAYGRWCAVEITADNGRAVFIPRGCAHGFQTVVDDTELLYLIDTPYVAESAAGVRWDDPRLAITWPMPDPILSARDRSLPRLI